MTEGECRISNGEGEGRQGGREREGGGGAGAGVRQRPAAGKTKRADRLRSGRRRMRGRGTLPPLTEGGAGAKGGGSA